MNLTTDLLRKRNVQMHCFSPFFIPLNRRKTSPLSSPSLFLYPFLLSVFSFDRKCAFTTALFTTAASDSIDCSFAGLKAML